MLFDLYRVIIQMSDIAAIRQKKKIKVNWSKYIFTDMIQSIYLFFRY